MSEIINLQHFYRMQTQILQREIKKKIKFNILNGMIVANNSKCAFQFQKEKKKLKKKKKKVDTYL